MKKLFAMMLLLFTSISISADIYEQLNNFGEKADQEAIQLLENTAISMDLADKQFLLFMVRDQFVCCAQVFPHVYDDQEYMIVRIWKSLFDELNQGEKRALFGHELTHIKNGDLERLSFNSWLSDRIYRMYAIALSLVHGIEIREELRFNIHRSLNCMAFALVLQAVIDEFHYLYEFHEKREREIKAELGSARFLKCAQDAISLNQKIEARLAYDQSETANPLLRAVELVKCYCASFYATHPSRQYFNQELGKLVLEQEKEAYALKKP